MIVLDTNIVVSAIVGRRTRAALNEVVSRGIALSIPDSQLSEAFVVLTKKLTLRTDEAGEGLNGLREIVRALDVQSYVRMEAAARARLHQRAQPDWPVLAAAMAFDAAVWSNDRDFFGVGVPVWLTRNIALAAPGAL